MTAENVVLSAVCLIMLLPLFLIAYAIVKQEVNRWNNP
jgi:hypothetical protein